MAAQLPVGLRPGIRLPDAGPSATSMVYPHLPHRMRVAAKDYYLNDLRRRFARRRNPIAADG